MEENDEESCLVARDVIDTVMLDALNEAEKNKVLLVQWILDDLLKVVVSGQLPPGTRPARGRVLLRPGKRQRLTMAEDEDEADPDYEPEWQQPRPKRARASRGLVRGSRRGSRGLRGAARPRGRGGQGRGRGRGRGRGQEPFNVSADDGSVSFNWSRKLTYKEPLMPQGTLNVEPQDLLRPCLTSWTPLMDADSCTRLPKDLAEIEMMPKDYVLLPRLPTLEELEGAETIVAMTLGHRHKWVELRPLMSRGNINLVHLRDLFHFISAVANVDAELPDLAHWRQMGAFWTPCGAWKNGFGAMRQIPKVGAFGPYGIFY
jgi:hypothetical protein